MNNLLYQFQTIGFECDKEFDKMIDIKNQYSNVKQCSKMLNRYNNDVNSTINQISNVIEQNKLHSSSFEIKPKTRKQRLQYCLDKMSNIDNSQQQLDRDCGIRAASIFSEKINKILPQQYQTQRPINQDLIISCNLQNNFLQVMEQTLLLRQYHKEQIKEQLLTSRRFNKKELNNNNNNNTTQEICKHYIKQYQINHLRLKDKIIDSNKKVLIDHKYCLDKQQLIKSNKNRDRIREVNEKININKIKAIQTLFKTSHKQNQQKAEEILSFLETYQNIDRDNQNIFNNIIQITDLIKMKIETYIKRIFFQFSNHKSDDLNQLYQFINKENYLICFKLSHIDIEEYELSQIYDNNIKLQNVDCKCGLSYQFFRDSLIDIANCLYLFPKKEQKIQQLIQEHLIEIYDQILDKNEISLLTINAYKQFNFLFENLIKQLFTLLQDKKIKLKSQVQQDELLNFDQIIQIFMKAQIFPTKISKGELRYYYYYTKKLDQGLNFKQFQHFINLLALHSNKRVSLNNDLKQIIDYNLFKIKQKCEETTDYELKIFRKLMIYYFHNEFLDLQYNDYYY